MWNYYSWNYYSKFMYDLIDTGYHHFLMFNDGECMFFTIELVGICPFIPYSCDNIETACLAADFLVYGL